MLQLLGLHEIYLFLDFRCATPNSNPGIGSLLQQFSGRRVTYVFPSLPT